MHFQIHSRSRVTLHRLVPACPMSIRASRGTTMLTRRGYARALHEGQAIDIPAFEAVDLHLSGGLFAPAACRIAFDDTALRTLVLHPDSERGSTGPGAHTALVLRELVSGNVFARPERDWNAQALASVLCTTPERVRSTLFRQGAALSEICRTQRLMRALVESIRARLTVADLKTRIGWAGCGDLEASFHDWFGVSLETVARLREDSL